MLVLRPLLLLGRSGLLNGLGEVLHSLLDAVASLGADGVQKGGASQIALSSQTEEGGQSLLITGVGKIVLVSQNAEKDTCGTRGKEAKGGSEKVSRHFLTGRLLR